VQAFVATLLRGGRVILETVTGELETTHSGGWRGRFTIPLEQEIHTGEKFTLALADGRAKEVHVRAVALDAMPPEVQFVSG
jgi:hypothetical protein